MPKLKLTNTSIDLELQRKYKDISSWKEQLDSIKAKLRESTDRGYNEMIMLMATSDEYNPLDWYRYGYLYFCTQKIEDTVPPPEAGTTKMKNAIKLKVSEK